MARYFFQVSDSGQLLTSDPRGFDFASPEAASAEGQRIARELGDSYAKSELELGVLEVFDEQGKEIARFPIYGGLNGQVMEFLPTEA